MRMAKSLSAIAAHKYLIETADHAVYSVKRLMGRGVEDIKDELKLFPFRLAEDLAPGEVLRIKLGDKTFTPPEISAFILRQLKRNAERYFSAPVSKRWSRFRRISTTHSGRRRRMPAASPASMCCAW